MKRIISYFPIYIHEMIQYVPSSQDLHCRVIIPLQFSICNQTIHNETPINFDQNENRCFCVLIITFQSITFFFFNLSSLPHPKHLVPHKHFPSSFSCTPPNGPFNFSNLSTNLRPSESRPFLTHVNYRIISPNLSVTKEH